MYLQTSEGTTIAGGRWTAPASSADDRVLARARGPVLDIGCGPGRHVRALVERGVVTLGIDLTPQLVATAQAGGLDVLHRCVFGPVPAAGRWRCALLLDGNVGIGGDPVALLRRIGDLVTPDGQVLVETAGPNTSAVTVTAHIDLDGQRGPTFAWQTLGMSTLAMAAPAAGMVVSEAWSDEGRWFALLDRRAA